MKNIALDLSEEEVIIKQAILAAREVQDWIWGEQALSTALIDIKVWIRCFEKRVNKIKQIDISHPHATIELRKRVLQQAALSIYLMRLLDLETQYQEGYNVQESNQIEKLNKMNFIS